MARAQLHKLEGVRTGTRVLIEGSVMSLSFNAVLGTAMTTSGSFPCVAPTGYTSITYGGAANVSLSPKGDPTRKRTLSAMLSELQSQGGFGTTTSALACPPRSAF